MSVVPIPAHRDARTLPHDTLEEMRRQAVRRILSDETHKAVANSLQVCRTTVSKWMILYRQGGDWALERRKAPGPTPKLSARQQERLKAIRLTKDPRHLRLDFALWTIPLVTLAIERKLGVIMHQTSVWHLIRRMGLRPQVPAGRAFARSDEECRQWMQEDFPAIIRFARRRQAVLLFSDESAIDGHAPIGRTWGVRGKRPVVRTVGGRRRINVISAIGPKGRFWFRCYTGTLTAKRHQEFLEGPLHDIRGEIVLVIDRHPAHTARSTRTYICTNRKRL